MSIVLVGVPGDALETEGGVPQSTTAWENQDCYKYRAGSNNHWGRGTTVNGSVGEHYWYIRIIITYMNKLVEVPSFD